MHIPTIQHLNYSEENVKNTVSSISFFSIPVTLKQGQGHQAHNDNVTSKIIYRQSLKGLALTVLEKRPMLFFFQVRKYIISFESMQFFFKWYNHGQLDGLNNHKNIKISVKTI